MAKPATGQIELKNKISFEDFDFRVGEIKGVKDHPNADKLYLIKVDMGKNTADDLQIVSGLKDYYKKNELLNKKIIVLRNLRDAVIRGVASQGMLLAAVHKKDLALLTAKNTDNGSRIFIDLREKAKKEVTIDDFVKLKMVVKDKKIFYNNNALRTEVEDVKVDKKIKDGAKIE